MNRLVTLAPLLLVTAWSGPWTCKTYSLPDGGTTTINPNPGGGNPQGGQAGTVGQTTPISYSTDGGQSGTAPGADGGVTVGSAASFKSDFVYMSNSADGTISRILIPANGSPYEQARYYCIVPIDNHGVEPCTGPGKTGASGFCTNGERDEWQVTADQLNTGNGGGNSPSRTLVDRSGNVWVALRAPGWQAGATEIVNVSDNLSQCTPRCQNRQGLQPGQSFTEGVPLQTAIGTTVTLTPPALIAPKSPYSMLYHCNDPGHDTTGTVETDPVNYDDCIKFSIPLGDPNPDPNADPKGMTRGSSFSRAAAMSPHCNAATSQCDVWIGQWNGQAEIDLSYAGSNGAPYDVYKVLWTAENPYGNTVDCAGILWEGPVCGNGIVGITTVGYTDTATGTYIPPYTDLTNVAGLSGYIPNRSGCGQYGIGSDVKQRIWLASWCGGNQACSFDAKTFLRDYIAVQNGALPSIPSGDVNSSWRTYQFAGITGNNGATRGVNSDMNNNIALGVWCGGAESFNPDKSGSVPCYDGTGASCPSALFNWINAWPGASCVVGVDFDQENDVWAGNYYGSATRLDGASGTTLANVPVGNGVYSYSDFTGYALRNVTLATALVTQDFAGCPSAPEFTQWDDLSYQASLPPGTDMEIQVVVSNSLDPAVLSTLSPITVCQSAQGGKCPNPINLESYNLPGGQYLVVEAILYPKVCSLGGGASAMDKPTLYGFGVTKTCPGN